jgi:anti-anti-sigma factor
MTTGKLLSPVQCPAPQDKQERAIMISNRLESATQALIQPVGQFTLASHREFRDACKAPVENPDVREILVDLGQVDYMDSSALGMLLVLQKSAMAAGKTVSLANASGNVRQVLDIANFQQLFDIR